MQKSKRNAKKKAVSTRFVTILFLFFRGANFREKSARSSRGTNKSQRSARSKMAVRFFIEHFICFYRIATAPPHLRDGNRIRHTGEWVHRSARLMSVAHSLSGPSTFL